MRMCNRDQRRKVFKFKLTANFCILCWHCPAQHDHGILPSLRCQERSARTGTFVCAVIIALEAGWKLALVMFALMPLIAVAGALIAKVMTAGSAKLAEGYSKANVASSQAISNIRTIASFQVRHPLRQSQHLSTANDMPVCMWPSHLASTVSPFVSLLMSTRGTPTFAARARLCSVRRRRRHRTTTTAICLRIRRRCRRAPRPPQAPLVASSTASCTARALVLPSAGGKTLQAITHEHALRSCAHLSPVLCCVHTT